MRSQLFAAGHPVATWPRTGLNRHIYNINRDTGTYYIIMEYGEWFLTRLAEPE